MKKLNLRLATQAIALSFIIAPLALAPTLLAEAKAPPERCEIISVKYTAWATRTNETTMSTLAVGDYLEVGDILEVKRGNVVQIAFDSNQSNILYVEGPTTMEISQLGNTEIELREGKVFALLDNLKQGQTFKVMTPTAIASVRGTQYKVESYGLITNLAVYKGSIRAYSRLSDGSASSTFKDIGVGQKLGFDGHMDKPLTPQNMSLDEASEISEIQWAARETKSELVEKGFESQINADISSEWDMSKNTGNEDDTGNAVVY